MKLWTGLLHLGWRKSDLIKNNLFFQSFFRKALTGEASASIFNGIKNELYLVLFKSSQFVIFSTIQTLFSSNFYELYFLHIYQLSMYLLQSL